VELLTAVNNILPFMTENIVTSISSKHPTVALILNRIEATRLLVLTDGYWFNEEVRTYYPSPSGDIAVPIDLLSMYPCDISLNYEIRGGFFYDLNKGTPLIPDKFEAKSIVDLPFNHLPIFAALAIQWRAAVEVYSGDFSVDTTVQLLKSNETEARALLDREHLRKKRFSTMRSLPGAHLRNALRG
jgi:hypothetical protein